VREEDARLHAHSVPVRGGAPHVERGFAVIGSDGRRIGTVDAVYVDYLLVRTAGLVPLDLYIPMPSVAGVEGGSVHVTATRDEVEERGWRRPLRRAPHP
jgi:hypothetical protein